MRGGVRRKAERIIPQSSYQNRKIKKRKDETNQIVFIMCLVYDVIYINCDGTKSEMS